MKISGSHTVPAGQSRTYQLLQDPLVLAKCIPGCDQLQRIGENEYKLTMRMLIASLSGLFEGTIKIADQRAPESFRLTVTGAGKIGFVKAEGVLTLQPKESATEVKYEGDVQIGGTIAGVGQRLLDGTSKLLIRKFFDNLSAAAVEQASGEPFGSAQDKPTKLAEGSHG